MNDLAQCWSLFAIGILVGFAVAVILKAFLG